MVSINFVNFSDLKLTEMETSVFASLTQLGFPIGGLMSGLMVSVMGKRFSSLFGQALSFILGKFSKMLKRENKYRPGQPNWEFIIWKFQDFSDTQILCEINFAHFEALKTAILFI